MAAVLFSNGSLRTDKSARLSLWAERSAFNAAAVVTATFGVTLYGRLEMASGSRLSLVSGAQNLPFRFSCAMRSPNLATSLACCWIATSMFR